MPADAPVLPDLTFHPLTAERWQDLATLFGERGAYSGCWCMWWRLTRSQFERQKGEGNRQALEQIVAGGDVPGLLAYAGGQPAAWCAVAPRERYPALERSRTLKRIDDAPVWSIVCFFVAKPFRHRGLTAALLRAAVAYAAEHGAQIVEGYPIEPENPDVPPFASYLGVASTFRRAGFIEVRRHSRRGVTMRWYAGEGADNYGGDEGAPRC